MHFALIDKKQVEASPKLKGVCPCCSQPVIAKCGKQKIWHWAHRINSACDSWWEPETEWHRAWKNNYPNEWQEVTLPDEKTGEKHIADVRTSHGLVIEFQHSHIDPQERTSREKFYQNMVWVVDGTRLKRDYHRFMGGEKARMSYNENKEIFKIAKPEKHFPHLWLKSSVPVIFEFNWTEQIDDKEDARNYFYCLFPLRTSYGGAIFAKISRSSFVNSTKSGNWSMRVKKFMESDSEFVLNKQEDLDQVSHKRKQTNSINEIECNHFSESDFPIKQPQIVFSSSRYGTRRDPLINVIEKRQFSKQFKSKGRRRG